MMNTATPLEQYEADLASGAIRNDPHQRVALAALEDIYQRLIRQEQRGVVMRSFSKAHRLLRSGPDTEKTGLYLWGSVGIGKTYLMDLFFEALPIEKKWRVHFHHFMREIHTRLTQYQGQTDPLKVIAREIRNRCVILCFDEFFVNDITDAMLLAGLLDAMFSAGVVMVATSNTAPSHLYWRGLQRQRFLPAIALIEKHMQVVHLETAQDYRVQYLKQTGVYFYPLNQGTQHKMESAFEKMAMHPVTDEPLCLLGRTIKVVKRSYDVAWFEFDVLCQPPRGTADYIELAGLFSTIFVSGIASIASDDKNKLMYLINLIDILYDHGVIVMLSANTPLDEIYPNGRLVHSFKRTLSRLHEMQSLAYWHSSKHNTLAKKKN